MSTIMGCHHCGEYFESTEIKYTRRVEDGRIYACPRCNHVSAAYNGYKCPHCGKVNPGLQRQVSRVPRLIWEYTCVRCTRVVTIDLTDQFKRKDRPRKSDV